jgi:hypothetical protein
MRAIILAGLLFFMAAPVLAADSDTPKGKGVSAKEEYELQERCGRRCQEVFKEQFGRGQAGDKDCHYLSNYESHYNIRLNKCFILVRTSAYCKDSVTEMDDLVDVNSNKIYGNFIGDTFGKTTIKPSGNVLDNHCNSLSEWDALVKPYMEE